jgi:hypothetical protein
LARLNQLAGNAARQSVSYLPQMTHPDDPRGWFQWYCRYDMGRRILDKDRRQIRG